MVKRSMVLLLACTSLILACSKSQPSEGAASVAAPAQKTAPAPIPTKKAYDGPFGLAMGLSTNEAAQLIPGLTEDPDGSYTTSSVPVSHDAFESYVLQFSKKSGLCAIVAVGKDIESGQTGFEIRSAFDAITQSLTEKYGHGKKYDYATGLMDDPQYWMIALSDKNRTLATFWGKDEGSTLPIGLSSIAIQAHASNMSTGFVHLRYEFANVRNCMEENKAKTNKAL